MGERVIFRKFQEVSTLRNTLISILGRLGDPALIAEARRRYAASATDATALPGNVRRAAMAVVARYADEAGWVQLRQATVAKKSALAARARQALSKN